MTGCKAKRFIFICAQRKGVIYLLYNMHTWMLGSLFGQAHRRNQLYVPIFRVLRPLTQSVIRTIRTCTIEATSNNHNANTCIGYNLAFYPYT